MSCICDWPDDCGGMRMLYCEGCGGGDTCVCLCGGESECYGCDQCPNGDDMDDEDYT